MDAETSSVEMQSLSRRALQGVASGARDSGGALIRAARAALLALPLGLRRDILYLWATVRLRSHPVKMLAGLTTLGVFCFAWQWAGAEYALQPLYAALQPVQSIFLNELYSKISPAWRTGLFWGLVGAAAVGLYFIGRFAWRAPRQAVGVAVGIAAFVLLWRWLSPFELRKLAMVELKLIFTQAAQAVFSSLNILSSISIFILAKTLRSLTRQNQLEALLMTPAPVRPSALFYALSTRYLPLALVAVMVIYLDPRDSPFKAYPFYIPPVGAMTAPGPAPGPAPAPPPGAPVVLPDLPASLGPLGWAAAREFSVIFFCMANLFMDLAIAYWLFSRRRPSYPVVLAAVVVIGFVTPVGLMWLHQLIHRWVGDQLLSGLGPVYWIVMKFDVLPDIETERLIGDSAHYLLTGVGSLALAFVLLWDLEARWRRILRSPKRDPVLIRSAG